MPEVILYAFEIAEMERWVGSRDAAFLREARTILREDEEADWEPEELEVLDRLLDRMVNEGQLYEGLGAEETYYLTQLLIDLFDEFVESEAVSEEMPLEALDQALQQLGPGEAIESARRWLVQGRLLGLDRTVWDRRAGIEDLLPYFGYLRREEIAPVTAAAADASRETGRSPRGAARGRGGGVLKQLSAAAREASETERDLLSFVSFSR
jgi:hypothetical protein